MEIISNIEHSIKIKVLEACNNFLKIMVLPYPYCITYLVSESLMEAQKILYLISKGLEETQKTIIL